MADSDSNSDEVTSSSILAELTTKMTEVLNRASAPSQIGSDHTVAPIGIKLDGNNYPLWSQQLYSLLHCQAGVDAIVTTYFDGSDTSQVYDLRRRVTRLKQAGGFLEKYYNDLQGLWREIDFRRPNPMTCQVDIQHCNTFIQEERVYVFLDGLDDRLDNIKSDVLQMKPFPTVEQAYAHVRREALRQAVMTDNSNELSGAVLASKGLKLHSSKILSQSKHKEPSNGTKCSHCGGNKHTSETCFKLHGYPDWWADFQARKHRDTTDINPGKAAVATIEPHLSLIPKLSSHTTEERSTPRRSSIANANGGLSAVTGAGTVMLSSALSLSNTLLDILTKEIIGRGTKRGGLYYMEDFSVGRAHDMHYPRNNKMEQVLLWHR
ncbi:hypothetical protein KIW84_071265 [Lathyrus oleraceus]|uniref:Retrotransposon Copia-like N-terminal domain-containing protein n=1 Tax=Pisum sativum TaxID=3888 RepID=A0A9D4ZUK4_PEA|nr:hypothetical protein KIW84_071265 [Pisum sativum]